MAHDTPPPSRKTNEDFDSRLDRLRSHLDDKQRTRDEAAAAADKSQRNASVLSRGFRLASEFIAAIAVGVVLGLSVDTVFASGPWGLIIFMMLGFAAGIVNVVRAEQELRRARTPPESAPADPPGRSKTSGKP